MTGKRETRSPKYNNNNKKNNKEIAVARI